MKLYLIIKFSMTNIFVNVIIENKNKKFCVFFQTFGQQYVRHSKGMHLELREFAINLASFINILKKDSIIVIFKNFSGRFKKISQKNFNLDQRRWLILKELMLAKIKFLQFIDESSIPYNGCKLKKYARKKLKHIRQIKKDAS